MELVVMIIMAMVCLGFLLKLSLHGMAGMWLVSLVMAVLTGLTVDMAACQSKTQIAGWLARSDLMLDVAVLLTVDVFLQQTFCFLSGRKLAGGDLGRIDSLLLAVAWWMPGLLIFPVLFVLLVLLIFSFPGADFARLALVFACSLSVGLPLLAKMVGMLLPSRGMRLELIFLVNCLIAVLGVVATVNGRTAVAGTDSVEWGALAGVGAVLVIGSLAGCLWRGYKDDKLKY